MGDYVPHRSEQLVMWLSTFVGGLTDYAAVLGLEAADIAPLEALCVELQAAVEDQSSKKNAAKAATVNKNVKHTESDEAVRRMARRICGHPAMTDTIRARLGLNIPDGIRTPQNTEVGQEVPEIRLEALPGRVIVHFGIDPASEHRNSKPAWATGCGIYRRKAGEDEYRMVGFQVASPFVDVITGPGADYTYIVRYQGRTAADQGVLSSPATISAGGLLAA